MDDLPTFTDCERNTAEMLSLLRQIRDLLRLIERRLFRA